MCDYGVKIHLIAKSFERELSTKMEVALFQIECDLATWQNGFQTGMIQQRNQMILQMLSY